MPLGVQPKLSFCTTCGVLTLKKILLLLKNAYLPNSGQQSLQKHILGHVRLLMLVPYNRTRCEIL